MIDFVLKDSKTYKAIIDFGIETDTLDLEGKIIRTEDTGHINESLIKKKLKEFIGEIDQIPPEYSAIKISGQRAYKMKRKGENPKISARKTKIHKMHLIKFIEKNPELPHIPKPPLKRGGMGISHQGLNQCNR